MYVGQYSLIYPDPDEQDITVMAMLMFEGYNSESKLHDIALVEVWISERLPREKQPQLCFFK